MEGDWSCYGGGQFNRGKGVMLQRWSLYLRENGHITGHFNGGKMVMLQRWSVQGWRMVMLRWWSV